jgi:hypothetical protein
LVREFCSSVVVSHADGKVPLFQPLAHIVSGDAGQLDYSYEMLPIHVLMAH